MNGARLAAHHSNNRSDSRKLFSIRRWTLFSVGDEMAPIYSGWLKGGNERRLRAVSCETIYTFIYRAAQRAEQLWRYLTRRHKRRRPRRSRASQDTIKDRVSIHDRPK